MEVVSIPKNDLGSCGVEFFGGHGLDGRLSADGHENRGLDSTTSGVQDASAGAAIGCL